MAGLTAAGALVSSVAFTRPACPRLAFRARHFRARSRGRPVVATRGAPPTGVVVGNGQVVALSWARSSRKYYASSCSHCVQPRTPTSMRGPCRCVNWASSRSWLSISEVWTRYCCRARIRGSAGPRWSTGSPQLGAEHRTRVGACVVSAVRVQPPRTGPPRIVPTARFGTGERLPHSAICRA